MAKSLFFFTFFLFFTSCRDNSSRKTSSILQGKWDVISVSQITSVLGDSLYYDLEKDSIHIPAEDLKEAYKDGHDSIFTVNLFKSMFGSLKESSFTFKKDSVVFITKSTKALGTYQIKSNDTLEMHLIHEQNEQEHTIYTFIFNGDLLYILLKTDIGYSKFILKKND